VELEELALWDTLKSLRSSVASGEGARDFQLQATVHASPDLEPKLRALGDNLREALVVSAAHLEADPSLAAGDAPRIVLAAAVGEKCSRCWKTLPLSGDPLHPTLCAPCATIVRELD
jgi:hypothetical protein